LFRLRRNTRFKQVYSKLRVAKVATKERALLTTPILFLIEFVVCCVCGLRTGNHSTTAMKPCEIQKLGGMLQ